MKKAFEILLTDKGVKAIFVNIFGGKSKFDPLRYPLTSFQGIMRCDFIAEGVIKATKELSLEVPLVVRLQGTKEEEAKT